MDAKQLRPQVLADRRGARKTWGVNIPSLNTLWKSVNLAGPFFHLQPLAGLVLAGGWADRLVLWLPLADQAARLLRSLMEARI